MTFTATTCIEARRIYPASEGWVIEIVLPLFVGDTYRINV